jgi:hypothetical protein
VVLASIEAWLGDREWASSCPGARTPVEVDNSDTPRPAPKRLARASPEPVADAREWGEHESIAELASAKKPGGR